MTRAPTDAQVEAARLIAIWIGYDWDGLKDHAIPAHFPDWATYGNMQGGKPAILRLVARIAAALAADDGPWSLVEKVVETFERDEADGYTTRDKTYALEMLRKAIALRGTADDGPVDEAQQERLARNIAYWHGQKLIQRTKDGMWITVASRALGEPHYEAYGQTDRYVERYWQQYTACADFVLEKLEKAADDGGTLPRGLNLNDRIACDIALPPATTIRAGCTIRTLLTALSNGRIRPLPPPPRSEP